MSSQGRSRIKKRVQIAAQSFINALQRAPVHISRTEPIRFRRRFRHRGTEKENEPADREMEQGEHGRHGSEFDGDSLPDGEFDDYRQAGEVPGLGESIRESNPEGPPPQYPATSLDEDTVNLPDPDGSTEDTQEELKSSLEDIQLTLDFIAAVKAATLDNCGLDEHYIHRLRNPSAENFMEIDDSDFLWALHTFFATTNASEATYEGVRRAALAHHPATNFPSYDIVKHCIQELSSVIPLYKDMCPNSCCAYTGPFKDLEQCPFCSAP
ncbi:hypothetical protein AX16_006397 [Volvariella volvacea WC 439]|nr:hypothetical protein AX16_006397 [Volvariella volvacea WC 439]